MLKKLTPCPKPECWPFIVAQQFMVAVVSRPWRHYCQIYHTDGTNVYKVCVLSISKGYPSPL